MTGARRGFELRRNAVDRCDRIICSDALAIGVRLGNGKGAHLATRAQAAELGVGAAHHS